MMTINVRLYRVVFQRVGHVFDAFVVEVILREIEIRQRLRLKDNG